jgi:signal transduction histidine kinase/CheY-like chemotaxis protein
VVSDTHEMMRSTRRRITLGYQLALSLVACVIVVIVGLVNLMVSYQSSDHAILYISGRQRMLLQRVALLAEDLAMHSSQMHTVTLQDLYTTLGEMETNREKLVHIALHDDRFFAHSDTLYSLYFEDPYQLDVKLGAFIQHASRLLHLDPAQITPQQRDMVALLALAHGSLLDELDNALTVYEAECVTRFAFFYHLVLTLSAFALFMLLTVALLVFRPAIAYVAQAQRRLTELNQLKGDFLANMSHEIRTPMNGIFGMTELLLESSLTSRQQHYARTLQISAEHLLGLINDILDFSKLEAGQMKIDPVQFNLLATVEDIIDLLAPKAREKKLELLLRYMPGTPRFVTADPGRVRQIFFNLIGNAIKFTDTGYVLVHVEKMGPTAAPDARSWLRVRFEDTGIGIPEDKIGTMFEKFMQVETGSTRAQQGTGLGLAICRNLTQLMEGSLTVESAPGKGTVFTWKIPLIAASAPQPATDRQALLAGKRVLLVDDLAPNRLLYKEMLREAGLECLVAENAEEALSLLAYEYDSGRPLHLVISDYIMPGIDGLELTRRIRANALYATLPILILSSVGERGLVKSFSDAGATACLAKPVTRQQLFDTLSHALELQAQGGIFNMMLPETGYALGSQQLFARDRPLHGIHILLAEDNRVNREITTEMLEHFGCDVSLAENGEAAVEMARAHPFDLIFLDCQMPVMDGFEAARHIVALKKAGQIAPVPIIALTANAMKGDREHCLESGMDDYLSKPMRKTSLEGMLLKWLGDTIDANAATPLPSPPPEVSHLLPASQTAAGLPALPEAEKYGIDTHAFQVASSILGAKLPIVLSYYLEDAEGYITRIAEALENADPNGAVIPAHTLKSSSRQFGVMRLADLASLAETQARNLPGGEALEAIEPVLHEMREAFNTARPFFEAAAAGAA